MVEMTGEESNKAMRSYYIESQGCQMNEHDAEVASALLETCGLHPADSPEKADVIILNTCTVRAGAEQRAVSRLNDLARRIPDDSLLGAMGCVVARLKESVFDVVKRLDFAVGPHSIGHLAEIVRGGSRQVLKLDGELSGRLPRLNQPPIAWLVAMRGCNSFCAYCIVPYVRGQQRSRPPQEILEEAERLLELGAKQIVLLGQNLAGYSYDGWRLESLLGEMTRISTIGWIRYETFYPSDVRRELLELIASERKLCKFLHIPIQAGSDRVLKAMGRRYTVRQYFELVQEARSIIPDVAISGDLIVGYPTETEQDHQQALKALEEIQYDFLFHFKYSPREGTRAFKLGDPIPPKVKARRLQEVIDLQRSISERKQRSFVGREMTVLATGVNPKREGELRGRTQNHYIVFFPASASLIGEFARVRITSSGTFSLRGEFLGPAEKPY